MKIISGIRDYKTAAGYIDRGRNKLDRPLNNKWLRISREDSIFIAPPIIIKRTYMPYPIIKFNRTHTAIPLSYPNHGDRQVILGYTGVEIIKNWDRKAKKKYLIIEDPSARTPPKMRTCRMCHGSGSRMAWCSPTYCYHDTVTGKPMHYLGYNSVCSKDVRAVFHVEPCQHGTSTGHYSETVGNCWNCAGSGQSDYGSKPIGHPVYGYETLIIENNTLYIE